MVRRYGTNGTRMYVHAMSQLSDWKRAHTQVVTLQVRTIGTTLSQQHYLKNVRTRVRTYVRTYTCTFSNQKVVT
jgi:hypothetical protein